MSASTPLNARAPAFHRRRPSALIISDPSGRLPPPRAPPRPVPQPPETERPSRRGRSRDGTIFKLKLKCRPSRFPSPPPADGATILEHVITCPTRGHDYRVTITRHLRDVVHTGPYSTETEYTVPGSDVDVKMHTVVFHEQASEVLEFDPSTVLQSLSKDTIKEGVSILETVALTHALLKRSKTKGDVMLSLICALKMFAGDSVTHRAMALIKSLPITEQAEENPDFGTSFTSGTSLPLYRLLVRAATLATSSALLMKSGIGHDLATLMQAYSSGLKQVLVEADFVTSVLDLVRYIVDRIGQCFESKSLSPFFHSQKTYTKWVDRAFGIFEADKIFTMAGQLTINESEHLSDLEEAIEEGIEILKFQRDADAKNAVGSALSRLRIIRASHLTRAANGAARTAPWAVLVCGPTSCGKSSFIEQLFVHHGKLTKQPIESKYKYTRTFADDYWTQYKTMQWCIVLDDLACTNPVKGTDDPSLRDIIALVNNIPFAPPQAEIENKGIPARPTFVVGSTNTPNLNAAIWFSNPAAVQRRFKYNVYLKPKAEFADPSNPHALRDDIDPSPPAGGYYDLWDIQVRRVIARMSGNEDEIKQVAEEFTHKTFKNIYEFLAWYNTVAMKYQSQQADLSSGFDSVRNVTLCEKCLIPELHCPCTPVLESDSDDESLIASLLATAEEIKLREQATEVVQVEPVDWTQSRIPYYVSGAAVMGAAVHAIRTHAPTLDEVFTRIQTEAVAYTRERVRAAVLRSLANLRDTYAPGLKRLAAVLAAVAGCYAAYKMYSKISGDEQGAEQSAPDPPPSTENLGILSAGITPKPAGDTVESPYQTDKVSRADYDFAPLVRSWNSLEPTKVTSIISKSVFALSVRRTVDGVVKRTDGVCMCLGGHLYVTTNHIMPDSGDLSLTFTYDPPGPGPSRNMVKRYTQEMLYRIPGSELVFFQNRDYTVKERMIQLVAKDSYSMDAPGVFIRRDRDGSLSTPHLSRVSWTGNSVVPDGRQLPLWSYDTPNSVGYCGTPVVQMSRRGPLLVGLHYLGSNPDLKCHAVALTQSVVQGAISHYGDLLVSPAAPLIESEYQTVTFGDNHPKSPISWVDDECTVNNYGTTSLPRTNGKSQVVRTILAEAAEQAGYVQEHFAPPMSGWKVGRNQLLPILQHTRTTDEARMRRCSEAYVDEIIAGLSDEDKAEVATVLSSEAAINGVPGTRFLDSMNFATSAGFPVLKSKREVVIDLPPDDVYSVKRTFKTPVLQRANRMRERYLNGQRASPIAVKHNKDEPRSRNKVESFQTRAINGLPVDHSIVARMYTALFVRVMMKNKMLFEAAPGMVAQSKEWHLLATQLLRSGKGSKIDSDYKWYDLKAEAAMILEAFRTIREIVRRCGGSEEQLTTIECLGEDIAFCFVAFDGDLFEFFGHNPSGHTLTVVINCIMNSLYSRYAYMGLHPHGDVRDYRMFVTQITYGDDDTKDTILKWFNHNNISRELESIGVTYTAADKSTGDIPFRNIDNVTFLKRSFRYDDDLGGYVAPLEEASIGKMLMVSIPSEKHPFMDAGDRVTTAAREYFWYGKEKFEEKLPVLQEILDRSVPPEYQRVQFPTWDELAEEYHTASVNADRYMGLDALERTRSYVRSQYPADHFDKMVALDSLTVYQQQASEIICNAVSFATHVHGAHYFVAPVVHGIGLSLISDKPLQQRSFIEHVRSGFAEQLLRPHSGVSLGSVFATIRILWFYILNVGPLGWPSHAGLDWIFLVLAMLKSRLGRQKSSDRFRCQPRGVFSYAWVTGCLISLFLLGCSSHIPHFAKPSVRGNPTICLERAHGAEECALGPSWPGRPPKSLFRDGFRQEPVQPPTVLMDVFTEDQTSGQTNTTQTTHATRSLIEVDLPVHFHAQSSEFTESAASVTTQQQTMRFVDSGVVDEIAAPPLGPYQPDSDDTGALGDFLSRPVLINAFDWLESNVTLEQLVFNPWTLFFSDLGIRRKLENYSRLRCKLHVKFVYNASPFYFGSMRACYFPLREKQGITRTIDQIRVSQSPGLYIEPQRGTTSSMELPFLWPGSWIDLANMADCTAMGSMHYVRFAGLRSANGVATAKVRISCYAWATDIELAGPTTYTVQSTEYDETGPVSGPASAVASLAGTLESVPVIGPFATATRIGAEAVSSVARVFGFTNPPVIDDVSPMAPKAFHAFSNVDTRMPIDKLTLDPKNEVTIDNSVVGASSDDELNLRHLVTRESFLSGAAWTESQLEGAQLFSAAISPGYALSTVIGTGGTTTTARGWTTGGYFAQFFDRWRGSVNYRFKFIKSKYHTGRVIISWDPQGVPGEDAETLTFSRLVDLQEEDDVIITIPFKARTPWLIQATRDAPFTNGGSALVGFDKAVHNGVLRVYVQNTLTGPAAAAEITMLVYTSCGTDCVFSVPKPLDSRYTFAQQAAEVDVIESDSITSSPAPWEDATEIITVGESIRSMRQILHRANWLEVGPVGLPWQDWDASTPVDKGAIGLKSAATMFPRVPIAFGKHPSGTSYSVRADDPTKYIAASQTRTPVLSFVLNCFAGYRGAMVHHVNVLSNGCDFVDSISATRTSRQWITTSDKAIRNGVVCDYDPWAYNMTNFLSGNIPSSVPVERHENFQGGSTLTNQRTQASTSVLMPYYSQWKFRPAWEFTRDVYPSDSTSNEYESLRLTATFRKPSVGESSEPWPMYEHYCAAGPDFNVVYFVCTPITYIKNTSIVFNVSVWTPPV